MRLATLVLMLLPLAGTARAADDFSGSWAMSGDVQGNPVNLDCAVTQAADATLGGRCQINGAESADIAGTVKDADVQFSFTVQGYTLTYTGKLEGERVSGVIEVAGVTGSFSGARSKA